MQLLPFQKSGVLPGKAGTVVLSFPCVLWQAQVNHKIQQKPASEIHVITCAALVITQWPKHSPYLQELQSSLVILILLKVGITLWQGPHQSEYTSSTAETR